MRERILHCENNSVDAPSLRPCVSPAGAHWVHSGRIPLAAHRMYPLQNDTTASRQLEAAAWSEDAR
jgi:hypothetical protein